MKIRMKQSCAGPVGVFGKGRELTVGSEIAKEDALSFLNSGLAEAVSDVGAETAEYPLHTGGGYYQLSDGSKVKGKAAAQKAEKKL